jgi:mannose-6-phosphate isomerase-like protein (cupin superfamily)
MSSEIARVDVATAEHYVWGEVCQAWRLLADPALSVHLEEVPPGAGERAHRHRRAQQFFYILSGCAVIEGEQGSVRVEAGQGARVPPGSVHRFRNDGTVPVRFLVVSAPSTADDRVDV